MKSNLQKLSFVAVGTLLAATTYITTQLPAFNSIVLVFMIGFDLAFVIALVQWLMFKKQSKNLF